MASRINIPITHQLLTDMGFEQLGSAGHYRVEDLTIALKADGEPAELKGPDKKLACWEDFLDHYRHTKGEDFEPARDPLRDAMDHEWQ